MLDPQEIIDALISFGALELEAIDAESGQLVYRVTEKLKEVFPAMYDELSEQIYKDTMSLWQKGLLSMDVTSDNPLVSPTEAALDRANWTNLSDGEYSTMNTIMRAFEGGI